MVNFKCALMHLLLMPHRFDQKFDLRISIHDCKNCAQHCIRLSLLCLHPGNISANIPVDRETQTQYIVPVEATDFGSPQLTRQANVTVIIDDINDNGPYFVQNYQASVLENATLGTSVLTVSAMDDDVGANAASTYR